MPGCLGNSQAIPPQKLSKHGTDLQHASIVAGLTYLQAKANDTAVHEQYSQRDERAGRLALIYNERE